MSVSVEVAEATIVRVGTCMAWQWMCPHYCGYVLGINADRGDIVHKAALHLTTHSKPQPTSDGAGETRGGR